jgi:hypothetical protein
MPSSEVRVLEDALRNQAKKVYDAELARNKVLRKENRRVKTIIDLAMRKADYALKAYLDTIVANIETQQLQDLQKASEPRMPSVKYSMLGAIRKEMKKQLLYTYSPFPE